MTTSATIILAFLAVVFVISGLSKASGNEKGLSGTRDVNVKDGIARVIGFFVQLFFRQGQKRAQIEAGGQQPRPCD